MLVGITCGHETITDSRGFFDPRFVVPASYAQAVADAGGTPVLLPHAAAHGVGEIIERLGALVISGGDFDLPPSYYGEEAREGTRRLAQERSSFERDLCLAALESGLPLLGVCGGMQLLNVVLGGSLYQDLSERPDTQEHEQPHDRREPHHPVELTAGSQLRHICGTPTLSVNSTHHQVVRDLGTGVTAVAVAPDGVVEAIEVKGKSFALGIQWHPEMLAAPEQQRIYAALVQTAQSQSK
jgi:putative glutamine amidotransferase